MKTGTRTIPKDEVIAQQGNNRIHIFTHRQEIVLQASETGSLRNTVEKRMTFDQLYRWIQENGE